MPLNLTLTEHRIRYVARGDRYDSLDPNSHNILMKFAYNDMYIQYDLEMKKARIENEIRVQNTCIDKALNDFYKEEITKEVYTRQYNLINSNIKRMMDEVKEIDRELQLLKGKTTQDDIKYTKIIQEYLELKKPTKKLLSSLIDKIEIDENLKVKIYYKIKPLF